MLKNKKQYIELIKELGNLKEEERNQVIRHLCQTDIFFLAFFVLDQQFYYNDFAFDLCKRVSENPWQLWLVARGHLKSLTITVAHNIQLILNNPNIAIAIPSYNLKTAKSFVRQIKIILESNALLKAMFPDVLYENPATQSPKWSEQEGLVVKRTSSRKEPTVMGFGLVDGQATGYHFDVLSFDDVVTQDSVTSPEMIAKTTERWQLADNIGNTADIPPVVFHIAQPGLQENDVISLIPVLHHTDRLRFRFPFRLDFHIHRDDHGIVFIFILFISGRFIHRDDHRIILVVLRKYRHADSGQDRSRQNHAYQTLHPFIPPGNLYFCQFWVLPWPYPAGSTPLRRVTNPRSTL